MSNMSYCRFENTLNDLRECYDALNEGALKQGGDDELSPSERGCFNELVDLCKAISDEFEDEINK